MGDDTLSDLARQAHGGVGGWLEEEEDGWRDEVGESYYLDMLRDDSRNKAYRDGIARAIDSVHTDGRTSSVLDIGTGSGLLAMMAKRAGASHVTACECFTPVARSAALCLRANGMDAQIDLVHKASTEMQETDMQASCRANIIVNELYDTELLGEGILPTLRHALNHLAAPDCIVVPAAADIVAVLLQSDDLYPGYHPYALRPHGHVHVFPESLGDGAASTASPPAWAKTFVSESVFLDKLVEKGGGRMLSGPALVSTIDFCKPPSRGTHGGEVLSLTVTQTGTVHAIAYWWDLQMCPGDANPLVAHASKGKGDRPSPGVLSMAPGEGWRDHWRQNICMLDAPVTVQQGEVVSLRACHDDWRIWFQVCTHLGGRGSCATRAQPPPPPPPPPDAPAEMRLPRVLFGGHTLRVLADAERAAAYHRVLSTSLPAAQAGACLTVGDGHWLALAAAHAGAHRVLDIEASPQALHLASQCFAAARLPPWRVGAFLVGWRRVICLRPTASCLALAASLLLPDTRVPRCKRASPGPPAACAPATEARGVGLTGVAALEQGHVSEDMVRQMVGTGTEGEGGSGDSDDEAQAVAAGLGLERGGVAMLLGDPFYLASHLGAFAGGGGTQWNNLVFWRHVHTLKPMLASSPPAAIVPCGASIFAMGVELASLRNPQQRVGRVEDLDLAPFCDIQPTTSESEPAAGVAYDLWMYDWRPLTDARQVMGLDFHVPPPPEVSADGALQGANAGRLDGSALQFVSAGRCDAVVMWLDWHLDSVVSVSCAPQRTRLDSHKQVIYFLEEGVAVEPGRQRLAVKHLRLDMEEYEVLAAFAVDAVPHSKQ